MRSVLSNRLEQTGDQRGSNDLEFEGLWVSDFYCGFTIVDFV